MGSIVLPNGESVYFADAATTYSAAAISAAEASSVAALMGNRERFDYVWANTAARTLQVGMVQGARGYQVDTKTEYMYDSGAWRLATPYIEFSGGSQSVPAATNVALSGWSVDNTNSTDTTLVTVSGNIFTFVRAGIYSMSLTSSITSPSSDSYQTVTSDTSGNVHIVIGPFAGVPVGSVPIPSLRIAADNTPVYTWARNANSSTIDSRRVRIARIG